jgi:cation:H+ antiporter
VVAGFVVAGVASRSVVDHVSALAYSLGVPPFLLGLTVVALGTDLPEIANSIIASVTQHGDMNVGDSVGSAVTQITLVLGILPFLVGRFRVGRRHVVIAGASICVGLATSTILLSDGHFSRYDGIILVILWVVGTLVILRFSGPASKPVEAGNEDPKWKNAGGAILGLGLVAAAATAIVVGFIEISEYYGLPEYIVTFFAGAIGTSLPELFVGFSALRRGARDLAVGDLFGSSFADATLSIGIGPIIAATSVSSELVLRGGIASFVIVLLVTLIFARIHIHDWKSGTILLILYAGLYVVLLG